MQVIFIIGNEGVPGQAQLRGRVKLNRSVEPGALASGYLNLVGKVMIHVDVSEQRHVVCDSRLAHACGDGPDTERATDVGGRAIDRKSTRLNSSHTIISYAVFCLKK